MKNAVIAAYARSPFTPATKGKLAGIRPDALAAQVVRGLVERTGVDAKEIEDLILGCAFPEAEQGFNLARLLVFLADLPISISGTTVNRFCGSSMTSVHIAAGSVAMGAGEAFICAGVESMTRVPMWGHNPMPHPGLQKRLPAAYMSMGETAENVARVCEISRADQEALSLESHVRAALAQREGRLAQEIVPINTSGGRVEVDGCIRPDTTLEALARLKPPFDKKGVVTAGTSSPLTDGAAAVLVCSEDFAERNGLSPLARIKAAAVAGCAPETMGLGPIEATKKALARAELSVDDLDVIELNEAFASQALACSRALKLDPAKVNIDGGAIALGHPLGATGARIVGKASQIMKRTGGRYALASQCIGGGQGIATILEAVQ